MMAEPHFADFLFILLIGLLIWGILALVKRPRNNKVSHPEPAKPLDREDDGPPAA